MILFNLSKIILASSVLIIFIDQYSLAIDSNAENDFFEAFHYVSKGQWAELKQSLDEKVVKYMFRKWLGRYLKCTLNASTAFIAVTMKQVTVESEIIIPKLQVQVVSCTPVKGVLYDDWYFVRSHPDEKTNRHFLLEEHGILKKYYSEENQLPLIAQVADSIVYLGAQIKPKWSRIANDADSGFYK